MDREKDELVRFEKKIFVMWNKNYDSVLNNFIPSVLYFWIEKNSFFGECRQFWSKSMFGRCAASPYT